MKSEDTKQEEFTPLMRQYFKIKEQYKDVIIFFVLVISMKCLEKMPESHPKSYK